MKLLRRLYDGDHEPDFYFTPVARPRPPSDREVALGALRFLLYVGGVVAAAALSGYTLACWQHGTWVHLW